MLARQLSSIILFALPRGCWHPSIAFAEQVTIEIPSAGWGITFDAPPLTKIEPARHLK